MTSQTLPRTCSKAQSVDRVDGKIVIVRCPKEAIVEAHYGDGAPSFYCVEHSPKDGQGFDRFPRIRTSVSA